jgi:hypothetical protein
MVINIACFVSWSGRVYAERWYNMDNNDIWIQLVIFNDCCIHVLKQPDDVTETCSEIERHFMWKSM